MIPSMELEWAMFTGIIIIVAAVVAIIIKITISSSGSHIYLIVARRDFRVLTILSTWTDYWKFMKQLYRMNAKNGIICLGQVFLAAGLQGVPFLPLSKSCAEHRALQRGLMRVPIQPRLFAWHSWFSKLLSLKMFHSSLESTIKPWYFRLHFISISFTLAQIGCKSSKSI